MLEVLLFSFSISIDAFGYSMGFGTRNIKIKRSEFFVLNLINTLILTILLISFSKISYILNNKIVESMAPILLLLFGAYYVLQSFISLFKQLKNIDCVNSENVFDNKKDYFKLSDIFLLFLVFLFENAFSTFVFYTSLNGIFLFVSSNFIFHYLFFLIGFDLGSKIVKKIGFSSSFISGFIFLFLGIFNLFG
ncbi:MAG: hypothetical protein IJW32_05395 [Clostridia bacterium]|nr:hypothetical protein [Clostridia bacterium]